MARKWLELEIFLRATATAPLFFTLAPPRRAPAFFSSRLWRGGAQSGASAQN